jgi:hypothetical protein
VVEYLTASNPQEQKAPETPAQDEGAEGNEDGDDVTIPAGSKMLGLRSKAARSIWNSAVVAEVPEQQAKVENGKMGSVSAELLRMQLTKKLRNKLFKVLEPATSRR